MATEADVRRICLSLPETIELVKIRTHQFAKRQMTWFRREPEVHWLREFGDDAETQSQAIALVQQLQH